MNLIQFMNSLGDALEQGDVVVIGEKQESLRGGPGDIPIAEVDLSTTSYDTRVCGIVCEVKVDLQMAAPEDTKGKKKAKVTQKAGKAKAPQPVASSLEELNDIDRTKVEPGQVGMIVTHGMFSHCKVDADIASIKVGDLLTTSPTKGHAQKVLDVSKATGAIIGKALGSLKKGKGKIPVLVALQ
jgi:hypothetical protein